MNNALTFTLFTVKQTADGEGYRNRLAKEDKTKGQTFSPDNERSESVYHASISTKNPMECGEWV